MERPPGLLYLTVFGIALVGGLTLTPLARRLALRLGVVDHGLREAVRPEPVALLGGLGIYGAAFAAAWMAVPGTRRELEGLFVAGLVILGFGLADDVFAMRPLAKLAAQVASALVLVTSGVQVQLVDVQVVDVVLTVGWIVAAINAVNLQDNMDGLAAGLATVSSIGVFALGYGEGQWVVAAAALGLAGASLGFLRSNWPRARIFMGDAGSMFVGLVLGFLALRLRFFDWPRSTTFFLPVLVLAVPLFDTALVTASRVRRGVPVTRGGLDHSSHRLVALGLTRPAAAAVLWSAQAACCLAAVVVANVGTAAVGPVLAAFVVGAGGAAFTLERAMAPVNSAELETESLAL
jgi:UDP-GlcNAc:undecaprenyl-phosphate GlcNAc-1-phosphate transferase